MSVYHPIDITCRCGETFATRVAHGVNVDRMPEIREAILEGSFHTVKCPACGSDTIIEKEFLYSDFSRNLFFKVKPRKSRHLWQEASTELERDMEKIPRELNPGENRHQRVVFGLGELREKLVAHEAGMDDRLVELAKVMLLYEHPFLMHQSRLRLQFHAVTAERLEFVALHDHGDKTFHVHLPRAVYDELAARPEEVRNWVAKGHRRRNIFEMSGDHWVNIWRWSPQNNALWSLYTYAFHARSGRDVDTGHGDFESMLTYLPRGSHLPAWAKRALRDLYDYAKAKNLPAVMDKLFELRFDMELDDDWAFNNDPDDIDTLWDLMRDLPDVNVEGNTFISALNLEPGINGGWYDPRTNEIAIGDGLLWHKESFEDVVRHEVGHAVHEKRDRTQNGQVSQWLKDAFGWAMYGSGNRDIDAWVGEMGGYGDLNDAQIRQVRDMLRQCLGPGGQWAPPNISFVPEDHPWRQSDFGPRLAFQQTGSRWYNRFRDWHRHGGKAFFVNFYYRMFMVVSEAALELVAKMPSAYASMSPYEFFAELYALHYDLDDPQRGAIPSEIGEWLDEHIGKPDNA